jgi:phosphopantetheine adenylyltransferase
MTNEATTLDCLKAQMEAAKEREFQALCKGLYIASDYWFEVQMTIEQKIQAL